jgi:hypothetical protein
MDDRRRRCIRVNQYITEMNACLLRGVQPFECNGMFSLRKLVFPEYIMTAFQLINCKSRFIVTTFKDYSYGEKDYRNKVEKRNGLSLRRHVVPGQREEVLDSRSHVCIGKVDADGKPIYNKYYNAREQIQEFINSDSCYWVLISTAAKTASTALEQYRERNGVELYFDDEKNLLDLKRLKNHNE